MVILHVLIKTLTAWSWDIICKYFINNSYYYVLIERSPRVGPFLSNVSRFTPSDRYQDLTMMLTWQQIFREVSVSTFMNLFQIGQIDTSSFRYTVFINRSTFRFSLITLLRMKILDRYKPLGPFTTQKTTDDRLFYRVLYSNKVSVLGSTTKKSFPPRTSLRSSLSL